MCGNFPNIKVTEGNAFSLVLPLKKRTYESCKPIDEDIDIMSLEDVVFKFGGVVYAATKEEAGVRVSLPATLARGVYDIVLTAMYQGSKIRAAYESAVTIVAWNSQSDAQQFIPGSPIVMDAAYVIGGTLTDAELEALKEEYREKNAQLAQAIEDAEAAKREWEEKAAELDGVAQEATSQEILTAVENIDIDTTDLAKEATLGTPLVGQPSTIFAAIAAGGATPEAVAQAVIDAVEIGVVSEGLTFMSGTQIRNGFDIICATNKITKIESYEPVELSEIFGFYGTVPNGYTAYVFSFALFQNLKEFIVPNGTFLLGSSNTGLCDTMTTLEYADIQNMTLRENRMFYRCTNLKFANIKNINRVSVTNYYVFVGCDNLIDIVWAGSTTASQNTLLANWSPTNALRNDISTLVDEGETFASNLEKLLYNIREHIAANLPDRTGLSSYTITFSAAVKAAILADQPTADAFTNKNWTIA